MVKFKVGDRIKHGDTVNVIKSVDFNRSPVCGKVHAYKLDNGHRYTGEVFKLVGPAPAEPTEAGIVVGS